MDTINILVAETIECGDSKISNILNNANNYDDENENENDEESKYFFNVKNMILDSQKIKSQHDELYSLIFDIDIIIFVIDIKMALTTADEIRGLHFLIDCINENKKINKITNLIILIDSCSNTDNNELKIKFENNILVLPNQILANNYNKIINFITRACESKNINLMNAMPLVVPVFLLTKYVNTYLTIIDSKNDNDISNIISSNTIFDVDIINAIGELYIGHKKWRNIKTMQKKILAIKNMDENNNILVNMGYDKFTEIFENLINVMKSKKLLKSQKISSRHSFDDIYELWNLIKHCLYILLILLIIYLCSIYFFNNKYIT